MSLKQKIEQMFDKYGMTELHFKLPMLANLYDDVIGLLDEAAKQIQEMMVAATSEHTHPSPEFWKGWNKAIDRVLAVLESNGKENVKP